MSTTNTENPFSEQVIAAVRDHMNLDHTEDSLLIVKSLGGQPDATEAEMSGMDGAGLDFLAKIDGKDTTVRVPWSEPLTERAQVRVEITRMYYDACAALGITPREAQEH